MNSYRNQTVIDEIGNFNFSKVRFLYVFYTFVFKKVYKKTNSTTYVQNEQKKKKTTRSAKTW